MFIVISDCLSYWPAVSLPCYHRVMTPSSTTIGKFWHYFRDMGVLVPLQTDGGPHFMNYDSRLS